LIAFYEKLGKIAGVNSTVPIPYVSDAIGRKIR